MGDLEHFFVWLVFAGAVTSLRAGKPQPGSDIRSSMWQCVWELHCKLGFPAIGAHL